MEFGDTALTAADWSYAKPRELMFLLVSSPPMTKDQIAAALWPDLSRQQLGNALHTALRELRRALGDPGWVVYSAGHYRFDRTRPHECDVTTFEDALIAARRARLGETARAIRHYEELTELLREQVGVPPATETTALYRKLMAAS